MLFVYNVRLAGRQYTVVEQINYKAKNFYIVIYYMEKWRRVIRTLRLTIVFLMVFLSEWVSRARETAVYDTQGTTREDLP